MADANGLGTCCLHGWRLWHPAWGHGRRADVLVLSTPSVTEQPTASLVGLRWASLVAPSVRALLRWCDYTLVNGLCARIPGGVALQSGQPV